MDLAEKTLKDLQRISAARAELECGPLARKLIEASIGGQQVSMENETSSGLAPLMIDLQHLVADAVRDLNISSPKDVVRVIDAITPEIFDKGQKQLGRVFVFLVLVVILVQRVAPERPSEEEVSLMSDCVAKCLSQHSQAWVHHQGMKWGFLTAITPGLLLMAGALIGTILLK